MNNDKTTLQFCSYEIDNLLAALDVAIQEAYTHCNWERQLNGQFGYTPDKKVRQLRYTKNSIERQLAEKPK